MSPNVGPRTGRTQLIATRLPHDLVARLDRIAARLSLPGLTVTRAEALRAAATAGLELLERQAPELRPDAAPPQATEPPAPVEPEAPARRSKAKARNTPNGRKGTVTGAAPADEAAADAWEGVARLDTEAALRGDRPRRFEVRRAKGGFVARQEGELAPIGTFPTLADAQGACFFRSRGELTWRPLMKGAHRG
jgi:hypothetical protein